MVIWLVVTGTMELYDFPYIGNFIVPTDELIFFRGVVYHQPGSDFRGSVENDMHRSRNCTSR